MTRALAGLMPAACITMLLLPCLSLAQERTWTDTQGRELIGELMEDQGDSVKLKVKGKEFVVPLSKLSEEDNQWLKDNRAQIEAKKEEQRKADAALVGAFKKFPKNDEQPVSFCVKYPQSYSSANPPPMLILFSPSGWGEGMVQKFKEACDKVGWICVGCDTFKNGEPDAVQDPLFEKLLPIIEKNIVHNPKRLYLGGMSGGAMRAFKYTGKFERPYAGVVACGGWLGKGYDNPYGKNMSIAWVNGDKDNGAGAWYGSDSSFLEKKYDCKSKLFQFPGGHEVGPPEVLTQALQWLEEEAAAAKK